MAIVPFILASQVGVVHADDLARVEGVHVIVAAPHNYIDGLASQISTFDRIYDNLYNLIGLVPFDGDKITILYDSSISSNVVWAGNPIRVGRNFWGENHFWVIGHEMAHDFTTWIPSAIPKVIFLDGGAGFYEGWAQFARQYIFYTMDMEAYNHFKLLEEQALSEYVQGGRNFFDVKRRKVRKCFRGYYAELYRSVWLGCNENLLPSNV